MKIIVVAVGRTTTPYIREAVDDYLKRINHYVTAEQRFVADFKTKKFRDLQSQKEAEGAELLAVVEPGDRLVLLDERGTEYTSREFASALQRRMAGGGVKRLVFAIGGPYGFSKKVYERADAKISLSKMTFSHEMVRLFFHEQIYRAMTILRGEPYHHD